jgi:hypothetical protein
MSEQSHTAPDEAERAKAGLGVDPSPPLLTSILNFLEPWVVISLVTNEWRVVFTVSTIDSWSRA